MRATANILIASYAEGEKSTVNTTTGEVTRRKWARLETADGHTFWPTPGTLNGEAASLGTVNKDGERCHLKAVAEVTVKPTGKGATCYVDLADLAITGEVWI